MINAAAVALGLLTVAGPAQLAKVAGKEVRATAQRAVEACQCHGADVSFLANKSKIRRRGL